MGRAKRGVMTPERFWLATALFHVMALLGAWRLARRWRDPEQCGKPLWTWATLLAREVFVLAVFIYGASLAATVAANVGYDQRRVHVGPITLRLLGQAIFLEGVLLTVVLALNHRRARRVLRACALGIVAMGVFAVNVDAYFIEPRQLKVRHHSVSDALGDTGERSGSSISRTCRPLRSGPTRDAPSRRGWRMLPTSSCLPATTCRTRWVAPPSSRQPQTSA